MNQDKQRIAIAEACVKTMSCCRCHKQAQVFKYGAPFCSDACAERCGEFQLDDGQLSVPNYPADLNAMHEAERTLNWDQQKRFIELLVEGAFHDEYCSEILWDSAWIAAHATAAQRAEAFLRTIGKWEEA